MTVNQLFYEDSDGSVANAIANRMVFYGGYLEMTSDMVAPPTHRRIPGVYLHAMAFSNLVRWGLGSNPGPIRESPSGFKLNSVALGLLYVTLTTVLWLIPEAAGKCLRFWGQPRSIWWSRRKMSPEKVRRALLKGLGFTVAAVIVAVLVQFLIAALIAFALFIFVRIEPINFMGVIILVAVTEIIRTAEYVKDFIVAWTKAKAASGAEVP